MVISPTKAKCHYQSTNLLHMLACDPLSFAKLVWPLVEYFQAFMIEITYTHIYKLTPTSGVTQTMLSIHKNKYSKVQRDVSSCNLAKGERGHWEKNICSRKHRKNVCALIKEHRKKLSMNPSKIKARGQSQGKEYLKTNKNISHTCTSQSSCMTSFFLNPVFRSITLCGTSESHTYPTQISTYKP
jgi:hypothetical protein